jgi:hypothetical protein
MKIPSSELYELIHALSESEQLGFLEKYAADDMPSDYIRLFKEYSAQMTFDELKIKKRLNPEKFRTHQSVFA